MVPCRGTLITLSDFSDSCKTAALFPGAAPITLINGDKLIELLIKHEIGVRKSAVTLYEVETDYFSKSEIPIAME